MNAKTLLKSALLKLLPVSVLLFTANTASAALYVTIVQGLSGMPLFEERFSDQQEQLHAASLSMADEARVKSFSGEEATRDNLLAHFKSQAESMTADDRAVIYLIGHGSYDGELYKFNIPGPDISHEDIAGILDNLPGQNHFLVNTSSASGAMLDTLDSTDRIFITATRNGNEKNATEFGEFFARALSSDEADLNKNNTVSIQEAFDYAERNVAAFFESEGKLATEHPQIRGEGAASFSLARVSDVQLPTGDNPEADNLLSRRLEIESEIEALQLRRNEYSNAEYIEQLQALVLESAEISEQIDALQAQSGAGDNQDAD